MEETEKMFAFKKAYAEIILNTAMEAASRVMVAERKAVRLQHDLRSTKDEALRMLIRFKQMIDAKTKEAENTSLSRQRKIEELDAQLNEAEGVIVDLRAELRTAQDRLEKVKSEKMLHKDGQFEKETAPYLENKTHDRTTDTFELFTTSLQISKCCNPENQTATSCYHFNNNSCVDNPNLASIIMASKEPELYRNGCTQRIRAIERNFLDGDLLSETLADQTSLKKTEEAVDVNVSDQNEETCTPPSTRAENRGTKSRVESDLLPVSSAADKYQPVKFRKTPRRNRCVNSKDTSFRFRRCRSNKHRHSSVDFSRCRRSICTENNNAKSGVVVCSQPVNEPEKNIAHEEKRTDNSDQGISILRRSLRKRKIRCWDNLTNSSKSCSSQSKKACLPSSDLSSCKKHWGNYGVRSSEHRLKAKYGAEIKDIGPILPSGPTELDSVSGLIHDNAVEDTDLIEILVQGEGEETENHGFSSCNIDSIADKVLSIDVEATDESACQTDKDRRLKYTFSRKRKKGLLSNSIDCSSLENNSTRSRIGEIINTYPELLESSWMTQSSKDSQNLVEIACQLVSLSGNRCGKESCA